MAEPRHYTLICVFTLLLLCGTILVHGAPRHKRQTQAYLRWFYRRFPWYARQMANRGATTTYRAVPTANQAYPTTNQAFPTTNAFPGTSTNQQTTSNNQYRRPISPPVRAYNQPGVNVKGPLILQKPGRPSFNNRGPLLGTVPLNTGPLANPPPDPPDPPDMVNGMLVTELPEAPEPPDPTDPPEYLHFPGVHGNMMAPGQGFMGIPMEVTDPPDMTDPPDYPYRPAIPALTTTIPPPTMAALVMPAPTTPPRVTQATPWPVVQNTNPFVAPILGVSTQPVRQDPAPVFQQAPPYIPSPPATPAPASSPPTRYWQSAARGVEQSTGQTPKTTPAPTAAPPTANRGSSWVMGANFNNMTPWRRMMWNRYFLNSV